MTKKRFNFYKIAVEPTDNLHLFANHDKGQIIKDAFSVDKPIEFVHFTVTYAYTKVAEYGDYIIGYLGKKSVASIGGPPEKLFEPTTTESWKKVLIVVNTSTKQPLGQTIALQKDVSVFDTPLIQINGLIREMVTHNEKLDGYDITSERLEKLINATEKFTNGDLADKKDILLAIGQNPVLLDKNLDVTPSEWLQPIAESASGIRMQLDMVRTLPQQIQKASEEAIMSNWRRR